MGSINCIRWIYIFKYTFNCLTEVQLKVNETYYRNWLYITDANWLYIDNIHTYISGNVDALVSITYSAIL